VPPIFFNAQDLLHNVRNVGTVSSLITVLPSRLFVHPFSKRSERGCSDIDAL